MPTLETSGTQTATLDTEHTLGPSGTEITTNKFFELWVDLGAMAFNDRTVFRVYLKCLTGGTERLAAQVPLWDAPTEKFFRSGPIPSDIWVRFTLEQTDGTGRSYPWKVLSWT